MSYTIQELKDRNLIIFEGISGSRAYGTQLPTSDTDIRGVFVMPLDDYLGNNYVEQVADEKNDIIYYELGRFLDLVMHNNPNIMELLNLPEDCILHKDPLFDELILKDKDSFITKQSKMTFSGYAIAQIKKAKGYNKKINWEESQMVRKTVIDFCYILDNGKSMLFADWLIKYYSDNYVISYKNFGLASVDHAHDLYAMYHMFDDEVGGIVSDPEKANDIQLVSIPKNRDMKAYLTFNKDAYSTHCKKYAEYLDWLSKRNEDRFKMNKDHGKNYDSKNLMHCVRLLNMSKEIAAGKIIVRRPPEDIEKLMKIRRGEMEYEEIIEHSEKMIKNLDKLFDESNLPIKLDKKTINNLIIKFRKIKYNI